MIIITVISIAPYLTNKGEHTVMMLMYHKTKFGCQRSSTSEDKAVQTVTFITMTLTLKPSNLHGWWISGCFGFFFFTVHVIVIARGSCINTVRLGVCCWKLARREKSMGWKSLAVLESWICISRVVDPKFTQLSYIPAPVQIVLLNISKVHPTELHTCPSPDCITEHRLYWLPYAYIYTYI